MRRVLAAVAVAGIALTGCGSASTNAKPGSSSTGPDKARVAAYHKCASTFTPLLTKLKAVNSRLDVGMVQADYNTALGGAKVTYDAVAFDTISQQCLTRVGVPLEDAFNAFVAANTRWTNCIQSTLGCDVTQDALPTMQTRWTRAGTLIAKAESGLTSLKP